jgi:alpha-amylase
MGDFDLDGQADARVENERLLAFLRPAVGGHLYELDDRRTRTNLLATLDRRPEPYHQAIISGDDTSPDRVHLPHHEVDLVQVYDLAPRKALVDHFFRPDVTLDSVQRDPSTEIGDFATGEYLADCDWKTGEVELTMTRNGTTGGAPVRVQKRVRLAIGSPALEVIYTLSNLPHDRPLLFGVEFNCAGMAGHAGDRVYTALDAENLGMLDARLDRDAVPGIRLQDDWRDLSCTFEWSIPAMLWCFPVETVSQSEAGFEKVYQSSVILPRWEVRGDSEGVWSVSLRWMLGDRTAGRRAGS